jgi:hypothetical protein
MYILEPTEVIMLCKVPRTLKENFMNQECVSLACFMSLYRSNRSRVRIPLRERDFSHVENGPHSLLFGAEILSIPGVKWQGCEVDHSPPSGADIMNKWSHTSIQPICLQVMDRENVCHSGVNQMLSSGVNITGTANSSSFQYVFGNQKCVRDFIL